MDKQRGRYSLEDLEFYGTREPLTRKGILLKAFSVLGLGFSVECKNEDALKVYENAVYLPGFEDTLMEGTKHTFTYGTGYAEIIWDDIFKKDEKGEYEIDPDTNMRVVLEEGKNILGYSIIDPKSMKPKFDLAGDIKYFLFKVKEDKAIRLTKAPKEKKFPPRKILHFRFDRIADNVTGYGLIEPLIPTIDTLMHIRLDVRKLFHRHTVPFCHMTKKKESIKDTEKTKIITNMGKVVKEISNANSFASDDTYKFEFHGIQGKKLDLTTEMNLILDTLSGGLGLPKPILIQTGESQNRSVLDRLAQSNVEETLFYQRALGRIIETQIFKRLQEVNEFVEPAFFKFNDITAESLDKRAEAMQKYTKVLETAMINGLIEVDKARDLFNVVMEIEESEEEEKGEEQPVEQKPKAEYKQFKKRKRGKE